MPVSMTAHSVTLICFDYAISLDTLEGVHLRIECPFTFSEPGSQPTIIDPERPGVNAIKSLNFLHKVITSCEIAESGSLVIEAENGSRISIEPNPDYEAWTIAAPHGEKVVCLPGGGLAIWNPVDEE